MKASLKHRRASVKGSLAVAATAVLSLAQSTASGALFIEVGQIDILPNQPGQSVPIYVWNTGPDAVSVAGLSLNVQVGDSGPADRGGLGTIAGPGISNVDLLTGALFAPNNTGQVNGAGALQFFNATTTTAADSITIAPGSPVLLANVEIDTTGFDLPGTAWEFRLQNTVNGPTRFFGANAQEILPLISDGILVAVPEPQLAAVALGAGIFAFAGFRAARRRA